jgi:uncharacterized membrane protein
MRINPMQLHDDSTVEQTVVVARPVETVYAFYRDFRNLTRFLGDVVQIELTGPATSRWTIQGPFGIQTHWTAQVLDERLNEFIHYETTNSPRLRTSWKIYFSPGPEAGQTEVREATRTPFGRLGRLALGLLGKSVSKEVSANLHRLKQVMETGIVTDTSYSIPGKFQQQPAARLRS